MFAAQEEEEEIELSEDSETESEWAPDPKAVDNPTEYKFKTWETTVLGMSVLVFVRHGKNVTALQYK